MAALIEKQPEKGALQNNAKGKSIKYIAKPHNML